MSGKCKWLTTGFLFVIGCIIGIGVVLFQQDNPIEAFTGETLPGNTFKGWEEKLNNEIHFESTTQMSTPFTHPVTHNPTLDRRNSAFTKRKPNSRFNTSEVVSTTATASSSNSPVPIPIPSTVPPKASKTWEDFNYEFRTDSNPRMSQKNVTVGGPWSTSDPSNPAVENPVENTHNKNSRYWENEGTESDSSPTYDESDVYDDDEEDFEDDISSAELNELLDLAGNIYATGLNSTDFQGFLRIINETFNQRNETGFLSQLNQLYYRPNLNSASDTSVGRHAFEGSLTAFAFMSFGVFLLNQIHNLVGKETPVVRVEGREMGNALQESNLDVLFNPPFVEGKDSRNIVVGEDTMNTTIEEVRSNTNGFSTGNYFNNMFRAMLNLLNAYTKDSQALECIWAIYCEDLDKTSANEGLYGLAARINSIGLRLIMQQISAELTMDVMMRSLLGWDGLPCKKMFPQCQPENATMTLRAATEETTTRPPTSQTKMLL